MPTDLHARATQQQIALEKAAGDVADALAAARAEHDRRHPAPASLPRSHWGTALGAAQHIDTARATLAARRAEEAQIRAAMASVTTAADAATFEAQLRALLVDDASLRVELRWAEERAAAARAEIDADGELAAAAEAEVAAATGRTAWADEHQKLGVDLRAALGQPPLAGIVAAAAAVRASAAYTAADDRIDALLPVELRTRATAREAEAADAATAAAARHAAAESALDDLAVARQPLDAAVGVASRRFLAAEATLRSYVSGAATELAVAEAMLARVAAHPALSAAQAAAVAVGANGAGDTAAGAEADLAAALATLAGKRAALDDAILAALVEDPDRDPETAPAVVTARAELEDAAVQGPVTDARAAYGNAERGALDAWEVEVPASLWEALAELLAATRILDRLADGAARTAIVAAADGAQDALATALDDHDVATRAAWAAGVIEARRRGTVAAGEATASERRLQYLRGDGPGGRTPTDL